MDTLNINKVGSLARQIATRIQNWLSSIQGIGLIVSSMDVKQRLSNILFEQIMKNGANITNENIRSYEKQGNEYVCLRCNKQYKTLKGLDSHFNRHDNINPYVCHVCNNAFPSEGQLYQHTRNNHA